MLLFIFKGKFLYDIQAQMRLFIKHNISYLYTEEFGTF